VERDRPHCRGIDHDSADIGLLPQALAGLPTLRHVPSCAAGLGGFVGIAGVPGIRVRPDLARIVWNQDNGTMEIGSLLFHPGLRDRYCAACLDQFLPCAPGKCIQARQTVCAGNRALQRFRIDSDRRPDSFLLGRPLRQSIARRLQLSIRKRTPLCPEPCHHRYRRSL